MDPVAPIASAAPPSARPPLRTGNRDDQPGAFWSTIDPPASQIGFRDLLAAINPLQHLPIIGTLYRELTGDVPHPAARVVGGAIFGGPTGMFTAVINAMLQQETGKDLAQLALAVVRGDHLGPSPDTLAAAAPATAPPAAADPEPPAPPEAAPETAVAERKADPSLWSLFIPSAAPPIAPEPEATATAAPLARDVGEAWTATRRASPSGTRDIGFYLARAGARVPTAGAMTAPINVAGGGPPAIARPTAIAALSALPVATQPDGGFTAAMQRGLDLYRSLKRPDDVGRALDVVE